MSAGEPNHTDKMQARRISPGPRAFFSEARRQRDTDRSRRLDTWRRIRPTQSNMPRRASGVVRGQRAGRQAASSTVSAGAPALPGGRRRFARVSRQFAVSSARTSRAVTDMKRLAHARVSSAPATINTTPPVTCQLTGSRRQTAASNTVTGRLSLSIGATHATGASCRARK